MSYQQCYQQPRLDAGYIAPFRIEKYFVGLPSGGNSRRIGRLRDINGHLRAITNDCDQTYTIR